MLKRLYHYGHQANSHDVTKAFAIITMVLDHIGLVTQSTWLHVIGRTAAPLFFFLVGYSKSYHWQNRILLYGIALTMFHLFIYYPPAIMLNILFSFIIIRLLLTWLAPVKLERTTLLALFIGCNVLSYYLYDHLEYGLLGLEIGLLGLFVREQRSYAIPWGIAAMSSYCAAQIITFKFYAPAPFFTTIALFIAIGAYCCFYKQRIWELAKPLRLTVLFLSRYSLEIYFYHFVGLLSAYSAVLYFRAH